MDKEAGTWVESGAAETLLTLEMIPQTMLPRHKNVAITELRRCVSELPFFLTPETSYTDLIGDVYGSREQ